MIVSELYRCFKESVGVCTDTRQLKKGELFFALKGDNFNGNAYAVQAIKQGASWAIVDEKAVSEQHSKCILVQNTLETLQKLATYHRKQFDIPVIALTGSNGKTTTKELMTLVLQKKYTVHATQGNFNNHIGVPLTLLRMSSGTQMAVIEMGANHEGEIEMLCEIAQPTHGLITNIGEAHLEGFGSFQGVLYAKSELYKYLILNNGAIFVNSQNDILKRLSTAFGQEAIYYGAKADFYHATYIHASPFVVYQNTEQVETQMVGAYNFANILTALAVGKYFGIDEKCANQAIATYRPTNNRSQIIKTHQNTIILDAYNANPSSMKAALKNFEQLQANYKLVILGDMLELGDQTASQHFQIVQLLGNMRFDKVLLCGAVFHKALTSIAFNQSIVSFAGKNELLIWLKNNPTVDAHILIKGSRGMKLEELVTCF